MSNGTTQIKETDEERKARKKVRKELKKTSFNILKELVDKQQDSKFRKALTTIRPSLYGVASAGRSTSTSKFIDYISGKGQVAENIIFNEFKMGRKECAGHIRKHLKRVEPSDRVWISFDLQTGNYKVAGKGENPPQNWAGYLPVEENLNLK